MSRPIANHATVALTDTATELVIYYQEEFDLTWDQAVHKLFYNGMTEYLANRPELEKKLEKFNAK